MLTRSRPLRLLVVDWVGAFGLSMMAGIVLLTVLKDFRCYELGSGLAAAVV